MTDDLFLSPVWPYTDTPSPRCAKKQWSDQKAVSRRERKGKQTEWSTPSDWLSLGCFLLFTHLSFLRFFFKEDFHVVFLLLLTTFFHARDWGQLWSFEWSPGRLSDVRDASAHFHSFFWKQILNRGMKPCQWAVEMKITK